MLALGIFVFKLQTAPYQEFQQQKSWRHPSTGRVGLRPAHQFIGPDEESITLTGVLLPEITGGPLHLTQLSSMADTGQGFPLIAQTGTVFGWFIIESIQSNRTFFFKDGTARRIEFTLTLKRVDDPPKPTPRQQTSQNEPGWQIIRGGVTPANGQTSSVLAIPSGIPPSTTTTDPNWKIYRGEVRRQ